MQQLSCFCCIDRLGQISYLFRSLQSSPGPWIGCKSGAPARQKSRGKCRVQMALREVPAAFPACASRASLRRAYAPGAMQPFGLFCCIQAAFPAGLSDWRSVGEAGPVQQMRELLRGRRWVGSGPFRADTLVGPDGWPTCAATGGGLSRRRVAAAIDDGGG